MAADHGFVRELICKVCTELYSEPKTLPCCHTFCSGCLKKSVKAKRECEEVVNLAEFPCPVCRKPFDCSNGIDSMPTNFKFANMINSVRSQGQYCGKCGGRISGQAPTLCEQCSTYLCDLCAWAHRADYKDHNLTDSSLPNRSRPIPIPVLPPGGMSPITSSLSPCFPSQLWPPAETCLSHKKERLCLYCVTCDKVICTVCKVMPTHVNCSVEYIDDKLVGNKKKFLQEQLESLRTSLDKVNAHLETLHSAQERLDVKREDLVCQIGKKSEEAIESIKCNKKDLSTHTLSIYEDKKLVVEEQVKKMNTLRDIVIQTLQRQETLDGLSDVEMLQTKREIKEKIDEIQKTIGVIHLIVPEDEILINLVTPNHPVRFGHLVEEISTFSTQVPSSITQGVPNKLLLKALNKKGKPIKEGGAPVDPSIYHAHCPASQLATEVTDNRDGTYVVRYIPTHHTPLTVSTGNFECTINVVRSYSPLVSIPSEYVINSAPYGICALPNNLLAISVQDKVIKIFDSERKNVIHEIRSNFVRPYLMALDKDTLWVTDREGHNVQRFSLGGDFEKTLHYGTKGTTVGTFQHPRGIAIHPTTGHVYVADMKNNRIQAFQVKDGNTLVSSGAFGTQGKGNGEFDQPAGIIFNQHDQLVVCDDRNCRLQVLDGEGRHIANYGVTAGARNGTLCSPIGITQDNYGRYIVGEFGSHLVTILDSNGDILSCVRSVNGEIGSLSHPRGVAVDDRGYIYVADFGNKRVIRM